jgi:transcriptional regulator with XRE-family HTH domain
LSLGDLLGVVSMPSENSDDRHTSPPLLLRRLGSELRRLREEVGLTTDQVAGKLYCSPSKISRLETGRVRASFRDIRDILDLYRVPEQQRASLHQLADEARHSDRWWHSCRDVPDVRTFMSFERATNSIRVFESLAIPGLLQVEGYAQLVTRALLSNLNDQEVARHVELRMERQELLRRRDAPVLQVVLDEATIQRLVGMPQVMEEQLARLRLAAQMSNVTVQVLPFTAGAQEGMGGSFIILGFPHKADRDVIFVELPAGQLYLDGEDHLLRYTRLFERLQAGALSGEESTAFMTAFARAQSLRNVEVVEMPADN